MLASDEGPFACIISWQVTKVGKKGSCNIAQWVRVLEAQTDSLGSITGTHIVEGENQRAVL